VFWRKLLKGSYDTGSGRGGPLGTPSWLLDEAPPSRSQEANWVVSGGGLVGPDDQGGPNREGHRSRPATTRRNPVRVIRVGRTTHRLHE